MKTTVSLFTATAVLLSGLTLATVDSDDARSAKQRSASNTLASNSGANTNASVPKMKRAFKKNYSIPVGLSWSLKSDAMTRFEVKKTMLRPVARFKTSCSRPTEKTWVQNGPPEPSLNIHESATF